MNEMIVAVIVGEVLVLFLMVWAGEPTRRPGAR